MKPSNKHKLKTKNKKQHKHREERKMKRFIKKADSKKGFNLVELICVIAIICILAGVLLFNYIGVFRNCMEALGGI
jgi:prepilin-type N-terminal cleavage/methylation domain-containing protein